MKNSRLRYRKKPLGEEGLCEFTFFSDSASSGKLPALVHLKTQIILAELRSRGFVIYQKAVSSRGGNGTKRNSTRVLSPRCFWGNRLNESVLNWIQAI